jgi:hypothetical protein
MAEELVKRGELVSDDIMLKILTNRLDTLHNQVRLRQPRRPSHHQAHLSVAAVDPRRFPKDSRAGKIVERTLTVDIPSLFSLRGGI